MKLKPIEFFQEQHKVNNMNITLFSCLFFFSVFQSATQWGRLWYWMEFGLLSEENWRKPLPPSLPTARGKDYHLLKCFQTILILFYFPKKKIQGGYYTNPVAIH